MTQSANILLKVISGPHLGAEIPLASGNIILGSSNSCDIILQDSTVAKRHLSISFSDDLSHGKTISIQTIDAPVILLSQEESEDIVPDDDTEIDSDLDSDSDSDQETQDFEELPEIEIDPETDDDLDLKPGESLVDGEADWKPLTPLMLGTTCIVWKFEKDSWGDIAASDFFLGRAFAQDEEIEDSALEGKDSDDLQKEKKAQKIITLPRIFRNILKGLAVLILFLFVFGPCIGTKSTRLAKDMTGVLKDEGFAYLHVTQTNIGVTIFGTVDTQAERNRLWQLAGKMKYPVFIDINVNEERAYAVKVALSVRGLFPEIELKENNIIIKGYMRDKLIEGASKIWIRKDIPNVEEIDSAMVYAFQVWPVLKDRLIKYKLEDFLVIRFHPGLVQVEGELDFDQREVLTTIKEEVCNALNSPIAFWDTLTAPGFSDEWNASLNSALHSKFGPDPGLAKLYFDSQSSKGVPAFAASTPEYKAGQKQTLISEIPVSHVVKQYEKDKLQEMVKDFEKVTDSKGQKLAIIKDKDGKIEGAVLLDDKGKIMLTPSGEPIIVPVIKDKDGNIVRDRKGKPVFGEQLSDARGEPVFVEKKSDSAKPQTSMPIARDDEGNILVDDQGRIVRGEVLRDEQGKIKRDEQGRILVKDSEGKIIKTRPAAKDDKGNILIDDQGRIVTGEVLRDEEGKIKSDDQGRILVKDSEGKIISAEPAAKDDKGDILVDDQGRIVRGEVLRDEQGRIKRDEQGRILVKDSEGKIVKVQPFEPVPAKPVPVIVGPVLDKEGKIIYDKDGKPIMGRAVFDKEGKIVTDAKGTPVILGTTLDEKGKPLRDSEGEPVPLTIARNAEGEVVRDKEGNPLLLPALLDKQGRIVRDKDGEPVAPRVISGSDNKAVFDKDGNLILDQDANKVLVRKKDDGNIGGIEESDLGTRKRDFYSNELFEGDSATSDKNIFGSGTVIADRLGKKEVEDLLGGLVIVSITLDPIPFISMKDGQKFFNGGKLPSGYVIKVIATDKIVMEREGITKNYKLRLE